MADTIPSYTDVAPTLKPFVQSGLTNAQNAMDPKNNPYYGLGSFFTDTGKTGLIGTNPMLDKYYTGSEGLTSSDSNAPATNMLSSAGLGSLNAGTNYMTTAGNSNYINSFMNPFLDNVTERQKQGAINDYARTIPGMGANASRVGGLGGSRNAIVQAEGQRNLGNKLDDISAKGLSDAYNNAQDILKQGTNFGLQGYNQATNAGTALSNAGNTEFQQKLAALSNLNTAGTSSRGIESENINKSLADRKAQSDYSAVQAERFLNSLKGISTGGIGSQPGSSSSSGDLVAILTGIMGALKGGG
jgi:hypothetical protein